MTITPDDVIPNAFIVLLESDPSNRTVSYSALDAYQKAVMKYLQKTEELVYSQFWVRSIDRFLSEYTDFFLETDDKNGILINKEVTVHCLKETFRKFLPLKMLKAFTDKSCVKYLFKEK